jgi:hypothetical protein
MMKHDTLEATPAADITMQLTDQHMVFASNLLLQTLARSALTPLLLLKLHVHLPCSKRLCLVVIRCSLSHRTDSH